jgi:adenosylhomocysteinase
MAADKALQYPVIAINDADTKHLFDNRYGTPARARSTAFCAPPTCCSPARPWWSRATAGADAAWPRAPAAWAPSCWSTEIDPVKALEAAMDGLQVVTMAEAAPRGDLFVTLTGNRSVIRREHFDRMKDGAVVCNSGHFNVELDLPALSEMSSEKRLARPFVDEYALPSGRRVFVPGRRPAHQPGRRRGPSRLGHGHVVRQPGPVGGVPEEERGRARARGHRGSGRTSTARWPVLKLAAMRITIDTLTPEQKAYLASWSEGT